MIKKGYLVYICDKNLEPENRYGVVIGVAKEKLRVKTLCESEMDAFTVKRNCVKVVFSPPEDEHRECVVE